MSNAYVQNLSEEDVHKLLNNPSAETKIEVVEKILTNYEKELLSSSEIAIAEQIFQFLVKDVETRVRKVLSERLKDSKHAPHDVIVTLAQDTNDEISLPVLEASEILTDEDLIAIISQTNHSPSHLAIAKRKNVSSLVSDALVDTENEVVVEQLLKNDAAVISDNSFNKIIENFSGNEQIVECVVENKCVAVATVEKLLTKISDLIRQKLERKYAKSHNARINAVIDKSRELATLKLLCANESESIITDMVEHLYTIGKLTPSTIITALCLGNMRFFEIALAKMTHIPVINAVTLMNDKGDRGFEALYKQAQMPESLLEAVRLVLRVVTEMHEKEERPEHRELDRYLNRMLEKILFHNSQHEVENLSYIIAVIRQNALLIRQ